MNKRILIVSFDTPYPTNYGGVYDVMAKISFFKEHGYAVDLVSICFDPERVSAFEKYSSQNNIFDNYKCIVAQLTVKKLVLSVMSLAPISMTLRDGYLGGCEFILENKYDFVLIEHTKMYPYVQHLSAMIDAPIYLRLHNDECQYYRELAKKTSSILKKAFLLSEALRYHRIQKHFLNDQSVSKFLLISQNDSSMFHGVYKHSDKIDILPIYVDKVIHTLDYNVENSKPYDFIYVGNLELDDNFDAVVLALKFLCQMGFTTVKVLIAGKCTSASRQLKIEKAVGAIIQNCFFKFNMTPCELVEVYNSGKVFLNFSTNSGGVKTKLMEALQYNISVLSNQEGVDNSGLDDLVILADASNVNLLNSIICDSEFRLQHVTAMAEKFRTYSTHVNDIYRTIFVEPFQ